MDDHIEILEKIGFIWSLTRGKPSCNVSKENNSDASVNARGISEETEAPKEDSAMEKLDQAVAKEGKSLGENF